MRTSQMNNGRPLDPTRDSTAEIAAAFRGKSSITIDSVVKAHIDTDGSRWIDATGEGVIVGLPGTDVLGMGKFGVVIHGDGSIYNARIESVDCAPLAILDGGDARNVQIKPRILRSNCAVFLAGEDSSATNLRLDLTGVTKDQLLGAAILCGNYHGVYPDGTIVGNRLQACTFPTVAGCEVINAPWTAFGSGCQGGTWKDCRAIRPGLAGFAMGEDAAGWQRTIEDCTVIDAGGDSIQSDCNANSNPARKVRNVRVKNFRSFASGRAAFGLYNAEGWTIDGVDVIGASMGAEHQGNKIRPAVIVSHGSRNIRIIGMTGHDCPGGLIHVLANYTAEDCDALAIGCVHVMPSPARLSFAAVNGNSRATLRWVGCVGASMPTVMPPVEE